MSVIKNKKALIIRFSSFGDIVQSSFVAESLTGYKTDLLTKSEFARAFKNFSVFNQVIAFNKNDKNSSLFSIAKEISKTKYDIIYDAHNNQRTALLKIYLFLLNPLSIFKIKTRSKYRLKRFLLFKLRINLFPKPFKGAESFLSPLNLKLKSPTNKDSLISKNKTDAATTTTASESRSTSTSTSTRRTTTELNILFAPSAAWDLKKWPTKHWIELSNKLKIHSLNIKFLGGPDDHFIKEISDKTPHTENLAGKLSWSETISEIKKARLLVSGDTGVLHIADFFNIPAIGLMGPSAFGYPSRESSTAFSLNLSCQPCSKDGRGKCRIKETKKCLNELSVDMVHQLIKEKLNESNTKP